MPRNYYLRTPPGRVRRARAEPGFTSRAAGKYEFAVPHRHSMQFRRVVEAQQPALHSVARGEFAHHRSHVASRPLHSARRIQLRKESKEHASSLPSAAPEHKMPQAGGFSGALAGGVVAHNVSKVLEVIEVNIGRMRGAIVHTEAIVDRGGACSRIARGLHVYFGIAHNQGLFRCDSKLPQNFVRAKGIGFLRVKTVTAINHAKIFRQTQRFQDAHADAFGLVGKDSHWNVAQFGERFRHARIRTCIVHFVFFVVAEEKLQAMLYLSSSRAATYSSRAQFPPAASEVS